LFVSFINKVVICLHLRFAVGLSINLPVVRPINMSCVRCSACVAVRDPYCSWLPSGQCAHSKNGYVLSLRFTRT